MRILYSLHGYKPAYRLGGPIVSVSALAENLVKRGHQVVVFASNSNLDEDLDLPINQPVMVNGVEVWYFEHKEPLKKYFSFIPYISQSVGYLYSPLLNKVIKQKIQEFDLVHTQTPFVYPTYAVGRAAICNGVPLFYQQRGAFAPGYMQFRGLKKRIYISLYERSLMKKAVSLIALNDAEVKFYQTLRVNTPCQIVPNGVNMSDYIQRMDGEIRLNNQFLIKPEDFVILSLARLHSVKGADFLLDVFLQIFNKYPSACLVLAGPDQHGFKETLLRIIKNAGANDRVAIPGAVIGNLKRDLLARADLFCLPSIAEGFSMSILEAMASKTPVLVTPECNFPSLAEKSAGWIVEKKKEIWVDTISYLIENPSELSLRGKNAFNLVRNLYTLENVVDKLEKVYAEGLLQASTLKSKK